MKEVTTVTTCDICGVRAVITSNVLPQLSTSTMAINHTGVRLFDYCFACQKAARDAVAQVLAERSGKPAHELDCWITVV